MWICSCVSSMPSGTRRSIIRTAATGVVLAGLLASLCGCGSDAGPGRATSLEVAPAVTLAVGVGSTVTFSVTAEDGSGATVPAGTVTWTSSAPSVATVDSRGMATALTTGKTSISVRTDDGVHAQAALEVWVPPVVAHYESGTSYFGRAHYVEYIPGDLPLVISAPHGGSMTPGEIPDRTWGETVTDANTEETLLAVRDAFIARTGYAPHVVLSHLERTKLDPNRDVEEGAQGNVFARNAWQEWHDFIEEAEGAVAERYGSGLYIDLHGHGHEIARAELGYLLSAADLNRPDDALDATGGAGTSIRDLAARTGASFSQLLRGSASLGGLLAAEGVAAVPSPSDPSPGSDPYFNGGYDVQVHGSRDPGRVVSGIQMELPRPGIRDTDANRQAFGAALAAAVQAYMAAHYGFFAPASAAATGASRFPTP